jgi:SAM-dependent methyltransferase
MALSQPVIHTPMLRTPPPEEKRTPQQLRQHYEVERELSDRLRNAPGDARLGLYTVLYDELYRRVPLHPRLTRKTDPVLARCAIEDAMLLLERFLKPDSVYLEIGPGDCGLTLHVSRRVKEAYAVEVSKEATKHIQAPPNMKLIISDGKTIDVPPGSVTVAYSNQVMEHIHPDDALEQLHNIYRALAPGGAYVCTTPNRLSGPHDISQYFEESATGMHMREYTAGELTKLFRGVGFYAVEGYMGVKRKYSRFPLGAIVAVEKGLETMPFPIRKRIAVMPGFRNFLRVTLVAIK